MDRFGQHPGTSLSPEHGGFPAAVNQQFGQVNSGPRSRVISMVPGPADADGSINAPFNPNSAARAKRDGLILGDEGVFQQAINDIGAPMSLLEWETPLRIHAIGGQYPDQIIRLRDPNMLVQFIAEGIVRIGSHLTFAAKIESTVHDVWAGGTVVPSFEVFASGGSPSVSFIFFGDVTFEDGGGGHNIQFTTQDCLVAEVDASVSMAGELRVSSHRTDFVKTFDAPTGRVYELVDCSFSQDVVFDEYRARGRGNHWAGDLTLATVPTSSAPYGFFACKVDGTFTGPAGTARFDKITQNLSSGVFAGGAGAGDYLE